jgi:hypothetical protein
MRNYENSDDVDDKEALLGRTGSVVIDCFGLVMTQ